MELNFNKFYPDTLEKISKNIENWPWTFKINEVRNTELIKFTTLNISELTTLFLVLKTKAPTMIFSVLNLVNTYFAL